MQRRPFVRLAFLTGAILVVAMVASASAQDSAPVSGFIEIHGQGVNGATVYLGDKSLGTIHENSLLVPNVYPGHYTLRVELAPFYPQAIPITVPPGKGVAVTVGVGSISVREQAEQSASGSLTLAPTSASVRLSCVPMECQLEIAHAESTAATRPLPRTTFQEHFGQDAILVTGLPQGRYTFTVTSGDKKLEATQGLCNGDKLLLTANFNVKLGGLSFGLTPYPNCKPLPVQSPKP